MSSPVRQRRTPRLSPAEAQAPTATGDSSRGLSIWTLVGVLAIIGLVATAIQWQNAASAPGTVRRFQEQQVATESQDSTLSSSDGATFSSFGIDSNRGGDDDDDRGFLDNIDIKGLFDDLRRVKPRGVIGLSVRVLGTSPPSRASAMGLKVVFVGDVVETAEFDFTSSARASNGRLSQQFNTTVDIGVYQSVRLALAPTFTGAAVLISEVTVVYGCDTFVHTETKWLGAVDQANSRGFASADLLNVTDFEQTTRTCSNQKFCVLGGCADCSSVSNCKRVSCKDPINSRCTACADDYFLNGAGQCNKCQPSNCPLGTSYNKKKCGDSGNGCTILVAEGANCRGMGLGSPCNDGNGRTSGDHCEYGAPTGTQLSCIGTTPVTVAVEQQVIGICDKFLRDTLVQELASKDTELLRRGDTAAAWVRFAFHNGGTHKRGGPAGFRACDANACTNPLDSTTCNLIDDNKGLEVSIGQLEGLWRQNNLQSKISRPDFWATCFARAITLTSEGQLGADFKGIQFDLKYGRRQCQPNTDILGILPSAEFNFEMSVDFFKTLPLGFNATDVAVLLGAHTLGRPQRKFSGYDRAWTEDPHIFNNKYFTHQFDCWEPELGQVAEPAAGLVAPREDEFQFCGVTSHLRGNETDLMRLPVDLAIGWNVWSAPHDPRSLLCSINPPTGCPAPRIGNMVIPFATLAFIPGSDGTQAFFDAFKPAYQRLLDSVDDPLRAAV